MSRQEGTFSFKLYLYLGRTSKLKIRYNSTLEKKFYNLYYKKKMLDISWNIAKQ